jgi:ERCC4-type nuclease
VSRDDLTLIVDTREQNPLFFDNFGVKVEYAALDAGDYSAKGLERYACIERKSGKDLWGTVHGSHDRFNAELSRLGDIPRVALIVDDAAGPEEIAASMYAHEIDAKRFVNIVRALQWKGRVPIIWCGNRGRAAHYVLWAMELAAEDYSPARLARCEEIARLAGPYTTLGEARTASLLSLFGACVVCARRPGVRPKPPGPGVCTCGRKALT